MPERLRVRHLISEGDEEVNIWQREALICRGAWSAPGWRFRLAAAASGRGGRSGEADKGKHKRRFMMLHRTHTHTRLAEPLPLVQRV